MEAVAVLAEVQVFPTQRGSARYVSRDEDGNEYTTFRQDIGERARQLQGRRVRLEYHQERRGPYRNVYLDRVEPAGPEPAAGEGTEPQEAARRTAVEAAPWLAGQPGRAVPPEQLYGKLKPFEERLAAGIEEHRGGPGDGRE